MIRTGGQTYPTITDAADYFKVSTKTVAAWIVKGIIPAPPHITYGTRTVEVFPATYLEEAAKALNKFRSARQSPRRRAVGRSGEGAS